MDWDDLRFFHAVANAGSLSEAARRLDVSQPTVGRRIRDLEKRLEARLFDRLTYGYSLTTTGKRILDKAEEMADAARCIADRVSGEASAPAGLVRLTSSEGIGALWLAPRLTALRRQHPAITVELSLCTNAVDISGGEADIALRVGDPRDENLVGRRVASVPFHLYASRCYAATHGIPETVEELQRHLVIHSCGRLAVVLQAVALRECAPDAPVSLALDNLVAQFAAVRAGIGLAALPSYLAGSTPDLVRVPANVFLVVIPVWLLTREDLKSSTRIRAVLSFVAGEAKQSLPQEDTEAAIAIDHARRHPCDCLGQGLAPAPLLPSEPTVVG